MSWAATWLHTWPLEQNKDHDWIITNNTNSSNWMPWKHIGTPGQGTVPVANVPCPAGISWSVHTCTRISWPRAMGNSTRVSSFVRGLVIEFKNARDLNDVKNRHLCLFLDQIGCDRSNDTYYSTFCRRPISPLSRGFTMLSPSASPTSEPAFFLAMGSN